jgi:hypothetical protein
MGRSFDPPYEPSTAGSVVTQRSCKPSDGRCQLCRRHVGRDSLVWDHCHICQLERGYLCNDCNTALTEHIIHHWQDATRWLFDHHECPPQLFHLPAPSQRREISFGKETRELRLGQGKDDPRTVRISINKDYVTIEQLAVFMGVTPGTVRDMVAGRRGKQPWAKKIGSTYLLAVPDAINYIIQRSKTT